ncbi:MAG: hypothetical protein WCK51_05160 [Armatimonadota bacterium]
MHKLALSFIILAIAIAAHADIVGKWNGSVDQSGIKISGGTMQMPTILMEIKKDGTYVNTYKQPTGERKVTGKWVRKGNDLLLTPDKMTGNKPPALTISKDEKMITMKVQAKMGSANDAAKNGTPLELKIVFKRA